MSDWLRAHQTRDPRTDLPGDSAAWETLLAAVWDREAGPGDCWAALHLMRCAGAVIREGRIGSPALLEMAQADYDAVRRVLIPHRDWLEEQLALALSIAAAARLPLASAVLQTDGACRGNPGPMAAGWAIRDPENRHAVLLRGGEYLGDEGTNQVAEIRAIILGLMEVAARTTARCILLQSDSKFTVDVLQRGHGPSAEHLVSLFQEARALAAGFEEVTFEWIRRLPFNAVADNEANAAFARHRTGQAA